MQQQCHADPDRGRLLGHHDESGQALVEQRQESEQSLVLSRMAGR
jgi:hypothetical protein